MSDVFALIAGGGTGGHVNPALAIADALVERGHGVPSIQFVGSSRGLEARLVPEAGYDITLLPGRGISREVSLESLKAVVGLGRAFLKAMSLMRKMRPSVVVSVGGYAAAPCAFAAVLQRVPLVLAESNAQPGAVHRLVGRFAKASAVALPGTKLPRAEVTGNPLRGAFSSYVPSAIGKKAARNGLGLDSDTVVVIAFGGSLGARSINKAVVELAQRWSDVKDVVIVHVVGSRDWNSVDAELDHAHAAEVNANYRAVEYESNMAQLFAAADIAICRSGATTVAELCAAGLGSILIPFPFAAGDHQSANAKTLKDVGAADVLSDANCDAEHLSEALVPLLESKKKRDEMGRAALAIAQPDAADKVAAIVERFSSTVLSGSRS